MPTVSRETERRAAIVSAEGAHLRWGAGRSVALCRVARSIASAAFNVPESEIQRPNRSIAASCEARHTAMYLAGVIFEVPFASIAREFGRDRTSVSHAIRRIEDRRDDRGFEEKLLVLERLAEHCRSLVEPS